MHRRLRSLALVLLLAANGCKSRNALLSRKPQIDVSPNPVLFQPLPAGKSETIVLQVRNVGNQDLHLSGDPTIAMTGGDGLVEYTLGTKLGLDCSGSPRPESSRLIISSGDCARVVVRYAPQNIADKDDALLTFASDDPDNGTLAVPMGLGDPAHLQVCTIKSDGSDDQCDTPTTQPPAVDFGMVVKGQSALRKVRLRNVGKSELTNVIVFDPDGPAASEYARSANAPNALDPTASVDVTVRFSPSAGGQRQSFLQVDSADPARPTVQIPLRGITQGPALCSDPSPVAFGQTDVGKTTEQTLTLSSCGSAAVTLQQSQFDVLSSPAFTAASLPGPQTLQPGDKLTVTLRFSPLDTGDVEGALLIPNSGQPDQFVALRGTGHMPDTCRLEASVNRLSFGQVVRGQSAQRQVTVANRGALPCNMSAVKIVSGGSYFSVIAPPAAAVVLKPGDAYAATVQYAPPATDTNSSDSGTLEFDSDDPLHAQLPVALDGQPAAAPVCKVQVNPAATGFGGFGGRVLQFGNVMVGRTKTLPVTVTNNGSAPCNLSGWKFVSGFGSLLGTTCTGGQSCGDYKIVSPPLAPLPPGQSTQISIAFSPKDTNQVPQFPYAYLNFHSGDTSHDSECGSNIPPDSGAGCINVGMSGQGDLSNLQVIPSDLDFGLVTLGCHAKQQTVSLYNTGASTPIHVNSIVLDPATAPFYVTAPPTPFAIGPGAKVQIQITYKPTQAARETATLKIASDASNATSQNPYVTVGLAGTGTTDKHQRDTFTQSAVPKVDMLFVIDDSGSFGFYQDQISQQANRFIQAALKYNADYQIGVCANDVVDRAAGSDASYQDTIYVGGLYGHPPIVTNATPDPAGAFSKNIKMGTNGTAQREAGLELAADVLSAPANQKAPPQGSQGFLRDDARLLVIDVQDDDDESNGTTSYYVDFFKSLKGQFNAGMVSFNAIGAFDETTGQPSQCIANDSEPGGQRYYEVAQGTGGKTWSICNADWGAIADQLALGAFSGRKQFPLTRWADPATVVVTLNGAPQTAGKDYNYDQPSNSIIFPAAPPPAAVIIADYDALCF